MKTLLGIVFAGSLMGTAVWGAEKKPAPDRAELEEMTRLQVFLDRANFGPGKIDGRGGEFTKKALEMYRSAHGEQQPSAGTAETGAESKSKDKGTRAGAVKLDTAGIDLSSVGEPFVKYTVTADDVQNIGEVPKEPAAMAKLKSVPYRNVLEGVAEKFHADVDFIKELNPEVKTDALKEGDTLVVPNAEPFELAAVKQIKPGEAVSTDQNADTAATTKDSKADKGDAKREPAEADSATQIALHVNTKEKMLEVREGEKLIAAFPVTPGSDSIPTPSGNWKVKGVAKMPDFRHDEKMLKEGERGDVAHVIPPGPNNPVGVIWIALNKKGIGIHGTDDPDTIGRAASHGCIRLANWDIAKLATMVKTGVSVTID
jgi:lipoprotein-anchoring transpeptidase ErfK/SrfK